MIRRFVCAGWLWALGGAAAAGIPAQGVHPRLFFGPEEVPGFREKAPRAPWKDMLAAVEWAVDHDFNNNYTTAIPRPANDAALHLFRGSEGGVDYASRALNDCLFLILAPDREGKAVWAQTSSRSLTRSGRAKQVALSFDLCHGAWAGRKVPAEFKTRDGKSHRVPAEVAGQDVNAFISKSLKLNADSLVKSGGPGWPGDGKAGNNWHAVRFGGAALSYLACDEPRAEWEASFQSALRGLIRHKQANLSTDPKANGWNPEGIAYAQYPGWTTYPLMIALRRLEGRDLAAEVPAMALELWSTYQGVLALPRYSRLSGPGEARRGWGLGLRPDFTDDHPVWDGEGTAALAFAVAPKELLPGIKWMFRRLCGDLGDRTWDAASGHGLYSLLFYPADLEEKNPAEVWGRTWKDEAFGMFIFRNRFQDGEDFVLQTVAKLRPTLGGHEGRDALSFRLWGLGVPWAVGSGRTTDPRGQTTLFPADPEEKASPPRGLVSKVNASFLRRSGDGFTVLSMEQSDTGVTRHTRRLLVDYSGGSGAPALVVVSDSSENGRFWRMNTPEFNTITTGPNRFTVTSPEGHRLEAVILWPAGGVMPRTGKFQRGNPFVYGDRGHDAAAGLMGSQGYSTQNAWVDFESPDGQFLVALTVVPKGTEPPEVRGEGEGALQTIRAGGRTVRMQAEGAVVDGWTRPEVRIRQPQDGSALESGASGVKISGTATDPDGVERVLVLLNGREVAQVKPDRGGNWETPPQAFPPGEHRIEVRAVDAQLDEGTADVSFRVHRGRPPELVLGAPVEPEGGQVPAGGEVVVEGRVADPDGGAVQVEMLANGERLAAVAPQEGQFRWVWKPVPIGTFDLAVAAVDADGDKKVIPAGRVAARFPVGTGSVSEATRLWVGDYADLRSPVQMKGAKGFHPQPEGVERWSIQQVDGAPAFRVRGVQRWDFAHRHLWILGSEKAKNWRLEWTMKMETPLEERPEAYVHFGAGSDGPLAMDFRPVESVKFGQSRQTAPTTTRLWYLGPNDNRMEIGWTVTAHTQADAGFPDRPGTTSAGIPDNKWNRYKMERSGRTLKVWRGDQLILEAESPWIASPGPVGFGNERTKGSTFAVRDIEFTPLP